jgi:hypothetical protein
MLRDAERALQKPFVGVAADGTNEHRVPALPLGKLEEEVRRHPGCC